MTANVALIKELSQHGHRIFSTQEAKSYAHSIGVQEEYIPQLLHHLKKSGLIHPLLRGLFALSNEVLPGPPLHEYEIAMRLIQPGAICCWSAMAFLHLTDQSINRTYILAPAGQTKTNSPYREYNVVNRHYVVIKTIPELYFGIEQQWQGEVSFYVTNLERTLLDGIIRPQYCGGFREVLHAYQEAASRMNISVLMDYAKRHSIAAAKRLGWILECLDLFPDERVYLRQIPYKSFIKLDASGPNKGICNKTWMIRENIQ